MKAVDIMEAFVISIEEKIFKEWRHEGFLCGWSNEYINVEIDGKEYMIRLHEVEDGNIGVRLDGYNNDRKES